jgi:tetratricopeptide (TPR) repeat protein
LGHKREAERTDPASALDWFLLGYADLQRGDIDGAHRAFDTALTLQPNHFWAQFYLAECHLRRREWDAAQAYLRGCAEQRPDFVWAYLRRGWASTEHQAWAAAEVDLGKARELLDRTPDPEALYCLHVYRGLLDYRRATLPTAGAEVRRAHLENAAAALRRAIGVKPDRSPAHTNLARVYLAQERLEDAKREMDEGRRRGAAALHLAAYHEDRARILLKKNDLEGAAAACRAALVQDPTLALAHGMLGQALLKLGRDPEAFEAFDRYIRHGGPPSGDVFLMRGEILMRRGDYLGARDEVTRALDLHAGAEEYAYRGWAYFFLDAFQPSRRDFDRAAALAPDRADARAGRGLCRVHLGDYRGGVTDAEEALRRKPETPEMMHNVACVFSLAVPRVEADPSAADRAALAARWQARAVETIRATLALVPAKARAHFWRETVARETAFEPIRLSREFQRLAKEMEGAAGKK